MNSSYDSTFFPSRIVSGGQTGVDRAGLELAIAHNIPHGGWCPRGRRSEDGTIPSRYELEELDSPDYPARTEQNVIDSDATLILFEVAIKGGTRLTRRYARRWDKPVLSLNIEAADPVELRDWIDLVRPNTLNIAGPRESSFPGIGDRAFAFLLQAFSRTP